MSGGTAPEAEQASMTRRIIGETTASVKLAPCFLARDYMLGEVGAMPARRGAAAGRPSAQCGGWM